MNDWDIVETYHANGVAKYVHANGMETTVKTIPTCSTEDKEKAVLFVSASVGCEQKCKFCYLTAKRMPFEEFEDDVVVEACKAVLDRAKLQDKYLKISFMGMGECFVSTFDISAISLDVFDYALGKELVKGIDGVDVGTSAPEFHSDGIYGTLHFLNNELKEMMHKNLADFNPHNDYSERSIVRVFMSLHGVSNRVRRSLMPRSRSMRDFNTMARKFIGLDVIYHFMAIDGVNDSICDIVDLYEYVQWLGDGAELRLLRFNKCDGVTLDESEMIDQIIDFFTKSDIKFKYQVSAGSEIKAACGQFICKEVKA